MAGKKERFARRGFTLVELLSAMAVVMILAGISLGLVRSIYRRTERARVKADLIRLAQGLEKFRTHHGDYPWIDLESDGSGELYAALIGQRGLRGNTIPGPDSILSAKRDPLLLRKGRHFVELAQLTLLNAPRPLEEAGGGGLVLSLDEGFETNRFLDPWGRPYLYRYKIAAEGRSGKAWLKKGYILFSTGPDGVKGPDLPANGIIPLSYHESKGARDNVFSSGL